MINQSIIVSDIAISKRTDGYVNATAMCRAGGKLLGHYLALESTKGFLEASSMFIGIPIDLLVQSNAKGKNETRGTWVHPKIAIHLAQWVSHEFAVQVSTWVEERIQEEANPALAIKRGVKGFQKQGKSDEWIKARTEGIIIRKDYTTTLIEHGLKPNEIAIPTATIHKAITDMSPQEHKEVLGVKQSPRNYMSKLELMITSATEALHEERVKDHQSFGLGQVMQQAKPACEFGREMRLGMEKALGRSIITRSLQ